MKKLAQTVTFWAIKLTNNSIQVYMLTVYKQFYQFLSVSCIQSFFFFHHIKNTLKILLCATRFLCIYIFCYLIFMIHHQIFPHFIINVIKANKYHLSTQLKRTVCMQFNVFFLVPCEESLNASNSSSSYSHVLSLPFVSVAKLCFRCE